jgi:hypothetical protein
MKKTAARIDAKNRRCTGREAAAAFAGIHLTPEEAMAWQKDLKAGLKSLKPQIDKWRQVS